MSPEEDDRKKVPFAPEWFLVMLETGFFGLRDWLELSEAPREAIELLDQIVHLAEFHGELTEAEYMLSQEEIDEILMIVSQMTENAARLGATFRSSLGSTPPREPLKWRAPHIKNGDAPIVLQINKNQN
jgi:hypothetical protein